LGGNAGYLSHNGGMEIAALFRSLMLALPGFEEFGRAKTAKLEEVFDRFFKWEEEVMVLGNPSAQEKKEHQEFVQAGLKLIRLIRKMDPKNEGLEMIEINLEDSHEMFHGLSPVEADKALSAFENAR
jgi:hypothetical protein